MARAEVTRSMLSARIAAFLPGALLAALVVAAMVLAAQLARPWYAVNLLRPWAEIGILALPLTAIILTGGIDLSVGSIVALASVVLGLAWHDWHLSIELAAVVALLAALVAGLGNGVLVVWGIPPLVASLATMAFYAGAAMAISGGRRFSDLPLHFCEVGQATWLGLPSQFWFLAVSALIAWLVVHHTRLGRYLFALGDNPVAALFAALPQRRVELAIYAASGLTAGLVALVYTARGGAAVPQAGVGLELSAIACVVLGGTRVTGGFGGVGRTLIGIGVMALLDLCLQLLGTLQVHFPGSDTPWELNAHGRSVLIGALVIGVAIWNERLARRSI